MSIISNGDKFASISMWNINAKVQMDTEINLDDNLYISTTLPFEVTDWWKEQLGQIDSEEIVNSDLFLITKKNSTDLKNINNENKELRECCSNYYYSFLLSGTISTESAPKLITGSKANNIATFREISNFEHPKCIIGTKPPIINKEKLSETYDLYKGMEKLIYNRKIKGRIIWSLNCFLNGLTGTHVYERIRNYIRTIEAFILPSTGRTKKDFKSRTEVFIGPKHHELIDEMYEVRSAIEHLHDPLIIINGKNKKDKYIRLLEIGFIAESIARFCIKRFLLNDNIWNNFSSDKEIELFWNKDKDSKKRIWGKEFDLSIIDEQFDKQNINYKEI